MSGSLKHTSGLLNAAAGVAAVPRRMLASLKYHCQGWMQPGLEAPESLLEKLSPQDTQFRHLSFTFAVIALSAKVACADGRVSPDKYIAFRDSFPLKDGVCGKLRSLFTLACRNEIPLEHYVSQVKFAFPGNNNLYRALLERLFIIARADGRVSAKSEKILSTIAHLLEMGAADFAALCALYESPSSGISTKQARRIIGVKGKEDEATIKKRYHQLMQDYHPDRYAALDLSPEVRQLLQFKSAEINEAYRALKKPVKA